MSKDMGRPVSYIVPASVFSMKEPHLLDLPRPIAYALSEYMKKLITLLKSKVEQKRSFEQKAEKITGEIEKLHAAIEITGTKLPAELRQSLPKAAAKPLPGGRYSKMTTPIAILELLQEERFKGAAPEITKILAERGWRTTADKPATIVYLALKRLADKGQIKRAKKGVNTIFFS